MKRPLCVLAVIFLLHMGVILFWDPIFGPIIPLIGGGLGLILALQKDKRGSFLAFLVVAGSLLSLLAIQGYQSRLETSRLLEGQEFIFQGYVTQVGPYSPNTITILAHLPDLGERMLRLSIRPGEVQAGDHISGRFRVIGLRQDSHGYFLSGGVILHGQQIGNLTLFHAEQEPLLWQAMDLRLKLQAQVLRAVASEAGSLLSGMLFSSRTGISDEISYCLDDAGLGHLFSVSGLHMSILTGLLLRLGRKFGIGRWSLLLCAAGVGIMAFTAGFSTSVLRAAVMTLLYLAGQALERRIDSFTSLGLAAMVIGLFYPPSIGEMGFQLSFATTLSILLFATPLSRWTKDQWIGRFGKAPVVVKAAAETIGVSLAAQIGVMPILGFREGYLPTYTLAANLLATPFVFLAVALGLSGTAFLLLDMDFSGSGILSIAALPVKGIAAIAQFFWKLPFGRIPTFFAWQRILLVGTVGVALIALALGRRSTRRKLLQLWFVVIIIICTFHILSQRDNILILTNPQSQAMTITLQGQTLVVYNDTDRNEYNTKMLDQMLIRTNLGKPNKILSLPDGNIIQLDQIQLLEKITAELPCPYATLVKVNGIKVLKFWAGYDIINQYTSPILWNQADIIVDMDWNLYAHHPQITITRRQEGDQFAVLNQGLI